MAQREQDHFLLQGGLDLVSSPLSIDNGSVLACRNYESVESGYGRAEGYERFDGRLAPSGATYSLLQFESAAMLAADGDTLTGGTSNATAYVISEPVTGEDDAAGYYVIADITGTFEDGENLMVGASVVGVGSGLPNAEAAETLVLNDAYTEAAAGRRASINRRYPWERPDARGVGLPWGELRFPRCCRCYVGWDVEGDDRRVGGRNWRHASAGWALRVPQPQLPWPSQHAGDVWRERRGEGV